MPLPASSARSRARHAAPRALRLAALALAGLAAAGCARAPDGSRGAPITDVREAAAPIARTPVEIAPGVVVTGAAFGVLEIDDDGAERFVPTAELPAVDGTTFGWVLQVQTERESLRWQEHLHLPKAPADWGDAVDDPDVLISKDGTEVVAQGEDPVANGELQRFYWTLAPGDPAGDYVLDVAVEGRPVAQFRFRVPAPVQETPVLVRSQGTTPWT
jgi:hypothetical protein